LPVNVTVQNSLPRNLSLQKITLSPSAVKVLIDPGLQPEQIRIETEPVDLQEIAATTTVAVKVVLPVGVSFPDGKSPSINATIKVKKKSSSRR
jgi:YbbR domain-containing protein